MELSTLFFRLHFPHWLEALNLMGCLHTAFKHIGILQALLVQSACDKSIKPRPTDKSPQRKGSKQVKDFLEDARRFLLAGRYVCERAPLQLYSSSLIFAPWKSIIREKCSRMPGWVQRVPKPPPNWGPEAQTLEGHASNVFDVTFSPDGALLASASYDASVRLWDVSTGQEVQEFEGKLGQAMRKVVFASLDSSTLATLSEDGTIRLWNVRTGNEMTTINSFGDDVVVSLVCSHDKALLACSVHGIISL